MTLKDEIEKIISAERRKLESGDQHNRKHVDRQLERFRPMRALLEELVKSIEPQYISALISEDGALIDVGEQAGSEHFDYDTHWDIHMKGRLEMKPAGAFLLHEEPGISVEETNHTGHQETMTFRTEKEAAAYLVQKIAEKVALYRHRKHPA